MKPTDNIEEKIKKELNFTASFELHDRMLGDVLDAQEKSNKTKSIIKSLNMWRQIMKSPVTKIAVVAVLIAALIYTTSLPSKSAWAQVVKAFNEASDIHIVKIDIIEDGVTIPVQEAWIKNQTLFMEETNDYLMVDDGKRVLTLYKDHKIAHVRNSFTPYWDYTPLILKVFRDGLSEDNIIIVAVPAERTETEDVYRIGFRGLWEGTVWVDRSLNLPVRIVGQQAVYRGQSRTFEMTFNYEIIPESMFSTTIPADYRELPRTNDAINPDRENVLFGKVIDGSNNPAPNAWVFASYAQYGRAMSNGEFALVVPPIDSSNSIGSADFPMLVWAYDDDPYHVAWTLIRHPESMRSEEYEEGTLQITERTNDGVELVIVNEDELSGFIPGEPGEIHEDTKVSDIILVMGPANVISGKVTSSTGEPVTGAMIQIETLKMQLGTNTLTIEGFDEDWRARAFDVTDDQGSYTIGHLPDRWCEVFLTAYATGFTTDGQFVTNTGENTIWDVRLHEGVPEDESEHFQNIIASGSPVRGGSNVISEVVPANINDSLILYYSFYSTDNQGIVEDISGQNNHAQVHGANYTQDDTLGGAILFDGDDDYISVPNIHLGEFTFSAWVKTETEAINNRRIFLLSDGERFFALQGNSRNSVGICDAEEEVNEYGWEFDTGVWTHITVNNDGRTLRIYKNGRLTEAGNHKSNSVTGTFYIGGIDSHRGGSWAGMIDEVALFNRALTTEEIEQLYSMTGSAF